MRLSMLQRYILIQCYNRPSYKMGRAALLNYYNERKKPKQELMTKIITHSLERLINSGLLVGYGIRTTEKWFIREIKLTKEGTKAARTLFSYQQRLPLKK